MKYLKIEKAEEGRIEIYTPYDAEFISELKKRVGGAKWDRNKKCWTAADTATATVREIMLNTFGTTDDCSDFVSAKVTAKKELSKLCGELMIAGVAVAYAYGRDSGAKACAGVEFISGAPRSSGSRANWYTEIPEGSVFVIREVSRAAIEKAAAENDRIEVEIIEQREDDKRSALLAEKENLLKRIAEIDAMLEKMGAE